MVVVVSVLVLYFEDPSLNPAKAYNFFCKICVWKELKLTNMRPELAQVNITFYPDLEVADINGWFLP